VITANTFRTNPSTIERAASGQRARDWTALAITLVRSAIAGEDAARRIWVAGSVAPVGDCYEPGMTIPSEVVLADHFAHVENIASAGGDLVLAETMNSGTEAAVVAEAAVRVGQPYLVSF